MEVPAEVVRDPWVREHVMGRVASIEPLDADRFRVGIRLATLTTGHDAAQAINMLFGNSSLHEHVELVDADFPPDFVAAFAGPRHGIDGIRRLAGVHGRPLTCAALKPQGLPVDRLATLAYTFATAGIDVVKDDHGLADQSYSPFAARVAACRRALERAERETGRPCLYAPSLVGAPRALEKQARIARDEGAQMVLVAPALVGLPAFHELVSEHLDVPVLAHPAYAGAARVAPPFAARHAVPAAGRRRGRLSQRRRALRLQCADLRCHRRSLPAAVAGDARDAAGPGGRHVGRARGRNRPRLRQRHDAARRGLAARGR